MLLDLYFQCYRAEIEQQYGIQPFNLILHAHGNKYSVDDYFNKIIYLPI